MPRVVVRCLVLVALIHLSPDPCRAQQIDALEPGGYLADPELRRVLENEVSGEIAKRHVAEISRFHRVRGGSPGSHAAAQYVKDVLLGYGYEDTVVESYLADGFTHYLGWRSPVGSRVEEAELWLLEPERKLLARYSDVAVSLMPYSNRSRAVGTVVDVGRGDRDEDYEGVAVRGHLVLATGGPSEVHRRAVIERGALGILCSPSGRADRQDYPDLVEMGRLSPRGDERDRTTFGFSLSERQSRQIRQWLSEGTEVEVEATVDAELFDGEMPVVSSVMRGSTYPDQEIVLIAHLDHYRPGAGDNATGSASNLEIARALRRLIARGKIKTPKRSIRMLWVPEFHGTMAYLSKHRDFGDRALAALNMDMTGQDQHATRSLLAYRRPPLSSPSYVGDVVENFLRYVDRADIRSPRGSQQLFNYRVGDYSGGSDHVPLVDSSIGVPAVMLGFSPDRFHHTSEDTVDKVDPTSLKRVTLVAMASVLFMANAEDEEAIRLAGEVSGQGLARLGRMTKRNVSELHEALASTGEAAFHERYRNGRAYMLFVGEVEQSAIRSTEDFASREATRRALAAIAAGMEAAVETELERLRLYYESLCEMHDLEPGMPELTATEKKAQQIVPVRQFRGMMGRYDTVMAAMVAKSKGEVWSSKGAPGTEPGVSYEESERWYRDRAESMGGLRTVSRTHFFELCNLMDGKRSVLEIRNALSAEFGETDLELVMRYVSDLEKLGLVTRR